MKGLTIHYRKSECSSLICANSQWYSQNTLTAPANPLQSYSTNEENRQSNHEPFFTEVESDFADDSEYFAPEADAPNTNEMCFPVQSCHIKKYSSWLRKNLMRRDGTHNHPL
jgi:hypothetical protein